MERLLRARTVEPDPEPLARGGLAHAVLADTLLGLRERTGSARLTPARLALARELLNVALRRHEHRYPLSAKAERVPSARRRLEADLARYLAHACAQSSPLEPTYLEIGFGFEDEQEGMDGERHDGGALGERSEARAEDGGGIATGGRLPALDLGGGVRLRGRIDRIDVGPDGQAVVYDYKGSSVTPSARWIADGKIQLALYMRAAEDLLGLKVVGGMYQPLGGVDLRARGILDGDSGLELGCVRNDVVGAGELEEIVAEAIALARDAAARAVTGAIDARPATCSYTGRCAYPAICRSGR